LVREVYSPRKLMYLRDVGGKETRRRKGVRYRCSRCGEGRGWLILPTLGVAWSPGCRGFCGSCVVAVMEERRKKLNPPSDPFADVELWQLARASMIPKLAVRAMKKGHPEPWYGFDDDEALALAAVAVANGGVLPRERSGEFKSGLVTAERKFLDRGSQEAREERPLRERRTLLGRAVRCSATPKGPRVGRPRTSGYAERGADHLLRIVAVIRREIANAGGSRAWPHRCPDDALTLIAGAVEERCPDTRFSRMVPKVRQPEVIRKSSDLEESDPGRMEGLRQLVDRVSEAMRKDAGETRDDRHFTPRGLVLRLANEAGFHLPKKWRSESAKEARWSEAATRG
jgi:hypothetical protein